MTISARGTATQLISAVAATPTGRHRSVRLPVVVLSVALGAVALAGGCGKSSNDRATLTATEREFSIGLSAQSVKAGEVRIAVRNDGATEHEFVAIRTDLNEADLPLVADATKIDEEGAGIVHLDPEAEGVPPGGAKTITLDLKPGRYVMVCNLPAHYKQGMHAVLTVT